jgi:PilZ domain-containing protein
MVKRSNLHHSPRYQVVLALAYTTTSEGTQIPEAKSGWTRNLSETGACLELPEALAPGTPLSLVLQTEGDRLALAAQVGWVAHPSLPGGRTLHGIFFPRLTTEQRQGLQAVLRREGDWEARVNRIPAALSVQCRIIGAPGEPVSGWTGDLGPEGCSLLLPDRLPVGTRVEVTLVAPRGDFTAEALVVWAEALERGRPGHLTRHGVRFTDPSKLRDLLVGFLLEGSLGKSGAGGPPGVSAPTPDSGGNPGTQPH